MMYTNIKISTPGIEVKVTDTRKIYSAFTIAASIMESIYFDELHDVMVIFYNDDIVTEVSYKKSLQNDKISGFTVSGKWYCLSDAQNIIHDIIDNIIQEQEDRQFIEDIFKEN